MVSPGGQVRSLSEDFILFNSTLLYQGIITHKAKKPRIYIYIYDRLISLERMTDGPK